ncbi:MAG: hypothetical protein ACRDAW_02470 [Metamycoplasmataceae bacterium]
MKRKNTFDLSLSILGNEKLISYCDQCGYYIILNSNEIDSEENIRDLKNYLFYENWCNNENQKDNLFIYTNLKNLPIKKIQNQNNKFNIKIVSPNKIKNQKPKDLEQKINTILKKLNYRNNYLGKKIDAVNIFSLFFIESIKEVDQINELFFLYKYLIEHKYLSFHFDINNSGTFDYESQFNFSQFKNSAFKIFKDNRFRIILEDKAYDFLINNKVNSTNVFVAMNFHNDNNWIKNCINDVLGENNLNMIHMEDYQHNEWIMDVIRDSIESSKFIICDFTQPIGKENSYGVYYESGFAEGKGKKVIHLCQKSSIEKLHFDIKQKNYIAYENKEELKRYLNLRIKSMY